MTKQTADEGRAGSDPDRQGEHPSQAEGEDTAREGQHPDPRIEGHPSQAEGDDAPDTADDDDMPLENPAG